MPVTRHAAFAVVFTAVLVAARAIAAAVFARAACALVLFALPLHAGAMDEAAFAAKVLAHGEPLEEAQIGLDIKQIELDASRDNYENWKVELFAEGGYRARDLQRVTTSTSEFETRSIDHPRDIGIEFEKRFLSNPSSFSASVTRGKERSWFERYKPASKTKPERTTNGFEERFETSYRIRYKYPLLKHDSNAESRKTYRRNILDLRAQQLLFLERKEDILESRLLDFFEWVSRRELARINRNFLDAYKRIDTAGETETALLKSAVVRVQKHNAENHAELRALAEKLALLLGDATLAHARPRLNLSKRGAPPPQNPAEYLRAHNRDLARIGVSIDLKEIDIAHFQNQLLPSLDVRVEASREHDSADTRTTDFRNKQNNYAAFLEFRYPLGGRASSRAALQIAKLDMRKLEIRYRDKLRDLLADMQILQAQLSPQQARLDEAVHAAMRGARIESANYRAGAASFRDLLRAHTDWRDAEIDRIENLIEYHEARVKYDNLLDRMLAPL